MRKLTSCGVILFRRQPALSFLLLRHKNRYDLPKGHMEPGETEVGCALRELEEETGLPAGDVQLDGAFRYTTVYHPRYRRFGGERVEKTVVLFLGWLVAPDRPIVPGEHQGHEWVPWRPPHRITPGTIDGVLAEVEKLFAANPALAQGPPPPA